MSLEVTIDTSGLDELSSSLDRIQSSIKENEVLMQDIAEAMTERNKDRIRKGVDYTGKAFTPHSPGYWRYRNGNRVQKPYDILIDTGALINGIRPKWNATTATVEAGKNSSHSYAWKHQTGFGNIPARPFLGIGPGDLDVVGELMIERLEDIIDGA